MDIHDFDFQIQTTASDGKQAPSECVRMAKENGCRVIAITDHDTVAGVREALQAGRELGIDVIPGIELSVEDNQIHLLGLGVDPGNPELLVATGEFAVSRELRAKEMVRRFAADGFVVSWENVMSEAKGAVVARPHIVDAILKRSENQKRLGGVSTKMEFFQKFFSDGSPYYVEHANISARDAIGLVRRAGGIAVWSHPPVPSFLEDCRGLEDFLKELIQYGLDGIEALGPSLTESMTCCLDTLASRYHLIRTGGSDFHEQQAPTKKAWPRSAVTIGEFPTYGFATVGIPEGVLRAIDDRHRTPSD